MTHDNIYRSLGLSPLINAAGTFTDLGGSLMSAEVLAAWHEAATHFVDMRELQDKIGQRIAEKLRVPAALVTGGAASSILLGVSAAISARQPALGQEHKTAERPFEVLQQKGHRDLYDRQIETCGVRIVEVESVADVAQQISDQTVLMMFYHVHELDGAIAHKKWLQLAQTHSIPTLLDAAADVPPVENLWKFNNMGYDMVAFSGGKAIRGPQGSGLLLGKQHFIGLAKEHASPAEGVIGRVAKVSKEDMVALWRAIEIFVEEGDLIADRCQRQLQTIANELDSIETLRCEFITPPQANRFPHLRISWNEELANLTANGLATALRKGRPPIATGRVAGTGNDGMLISAVNLKLGEEKTVADRIANVLRSTPIG